jgi:hypothetical protein
MKAPKENLRLRHVLQNAAYYFLSRKRENLIRLLMKPKGNGRDNVLINLLDE